MFSFFPLTNSVSKLDVVDDQTFVVNPLKTF